MSNNENPFASYSTSDLEQMLKVRLKRRTANQTADSARVIAYLEAELASRVSA